MLAKENKRRALITLFVFLVSLLGSSVLFVKASIFNSVANLFSGGTTSYQGKVNLNSTEFLRPNISVFSFLDKNNNKKNKEAAEEDDSSLMEIDEDGLLVVQSGSMRVSTEKEKPINDTISLYEVKEGDTLYSVASLFGVSRNTIIWANNLKSNKISKGDVLLIFPMSGIQYTIKTAGTIRDIAKKYNTDANEIAEYNGIGVDTKLAKGDTIFIPDAEGEIEAEIAKANTKSGGDKNKIAKKKVVPKYKNNVVAGYFMMPVSGCRRTQGAHGPYGTAIDFGCPVGTPIVASAEGVVIRADAAGYNGGYGEVIIISHSNGTQSIYSHLSRIDVAQGQKVSQGQIIGATGNTGRSTGPHLHFETRGTANPF